MSVPITPGSGATSVASEAISGLQYQQIKVVDGTAASTNLWKINADGSSNVNVASSVLVTGALSFSGSVATLQGTTPWVSTNVGSIITIQVGSVISVPTGSVITVFQTPSIVGTYAEDSAHTSGDKGILSLNVRNDTMASVTSADGDYGALALGPAGEGIFANSPLTKWVQGTADFRNGNAGASIITIASGGSSVFTYITGVQIANMGSASVLVTLAAGGSTLGYSIAPAGGGSNIYYQNALKTPANFGFAASISGISSVLVSAQGFTAKI